MFDVHRSTLAVVTAVFATLPLTAGACDGLVRGPKGTVAAVTDGDTLLLDTGLVVRLIGTQAPKLPLGREGFSPWPKADEARTALEAMTLGQTVQLYYGGGRLDRYGRALGQLYLAGDPQVWVQGQMIATGMARVYSFPDNRACVAELLGLEAKARADGLGIWRDPYYSVRRADRPEALAAREGGYELVEGRVLQAEQSGGRVYLNFGRVWKEDFTVTIDSGALKSFDGMDPLGLEGALIRVRGWVESRDGPRLEVTHPEQIEVLSRP